MQIQHYPHQGSEFLERKVAGSVKVCELESKRKQLIVIKSAVVVQCREEIYEVNFFLNSKCIECSDRKGPLANVYSD